MSLYIKHNGDVATQDPQCGYKTQSQRNQLQHAEVYPFAQQVACIN
jgi:hypothetical protein